MTSLTAKMVNYQLFYYHGQFQFTWHWELNVVRLGPTNVEISLTSHHEQLPVDIKDIYYIQENSQTKIIQFNYVNLLFTVCDGSLYGSNVLLRGEKLSVNGYYTPFRLETCL